MPLIRHYIDADAAADAIADCRHAGRFAVRHFHFHYFTLFTFITAFHADIIADAEMPPLRCCRSMLIA